MIKVSPIKNTIPMVNKINLPPIGFIGAGNMARAIMTRINACAKSELIASDIDDTALQRIAAVSKTTGNNQEVIDKSKYIFICVKPQFAEEALANLKFNSDKIVVSIMAGTTLTTLQNLTLSKCIVRLMPNMNAVSGTSFNGFSCLGLEQNDKNELNSILSCFGIPSEFSEEHLSAVTGIAGSGPAFVLQFLKGLVQAGQSSGLDIQRALDMSLAVLSGTSVNFAASHRKNIGSYTDAFNTIDSLTNSICSKGGTTIQGIDYLNQNEFTEHVAIATIKSVNKAKELSSSN